MLNFQEQALADLESVFINPANMEFATRHTITGELGDSEIYVVVDNDLLMERALSSQAENVSVGGMLFFAKKSDWLEKIGHVPRAGESLLFDRHDYLVKQVNDDMGMLEVTLTSNEDTDGW